MKIIALIAFWAFVIGGGSIGYFSASECDRLENTFLGLFIGVFIGILAVGGSIGICYLLK